MKTVYFVGMHNKPECKPLDSKTVSGKMIDKIIAQLNYPCIKTNMCDLEYQPKDNERIFIEVQNWYEKYTPKDNDIVVLLGKWVQKHFFIVNLTRIDINHPASIYKKEDKELYIKTAVNKIINY